MMNHDNEGLVYDSAKLHLHVLGYNLAQASKPNKEGVVHHELEGYNDVVLEVVVHDYTDDLHHDTGPHHHADLRRLHDSLLEMDDTTTTVGVRWTSLLVALDS